MRNQGFFYSIRNSPRRDFTIRKIPQTGDGCMIKIGIAGARGLSTLMGFNEIPDATVAAVCDLDEGVLKRVSEKHGIPRTYRVFEDMLESDIDAVVIATPMQCHVPRRLRL